MLYMAVFGGERVVSYDPFLTVDGDTVTLLTTTTAARMLAEYLMQMAQFKTNVMKCTFYEKEYIRVVTTKYRDPT
jgi:hypothetical protein